MRLPQTPLTPVVAALAVLIAMHLAAQVWSIGFPPNGSSYVAPNPVPGMASVGADLQIVLRASQAWRAGATDFEQVRGKAQESDSWHRMFPYPPLVYQVLAPLSFLDDRNALRVWGLAFLVLFPLGLGLYLRSAHPRLSAVRPAALAGALGTFALSAAMLLQLERGNFDWLVAVCWLLGLALLARGRDLPAGVAIGLSAALKLYPVVLLPVLLVQRRFRALAAAVGTGLAVLLVTGPRNNLQWLRALGAERTEWLEVRAWHTTVANLVGALHPTIAPGTASKIGLGVWALLLAALVAVLFLRARRHDPLDAVHAGVLAVPLMYLVPATAASYTLFSLLPLLFVAADGWTERPQLRPALLGLGVFVGLCQAPLMAWALLNRGPMWLTPTVSLAVIALAVLGPILAWRLPGAGVRPQA